MERFDEAMKVCRNCNKAYRMARREHYCPNCASIWLEDRTDPVPLNKDAEPQPTATADQFSTLFRTFKTFLQEKDGQV